MKPVDDRDTRALRNRHAKNGVAVVLERMTLDEWDALLAGEISADELEAKYRPDGEGCRDVTEQSDLGRWST